MRIEVVQNNPIDSNCYILWNDDNKGIVVDPGSKDSAAILDAIKIHNVIPQLVLLTHEHFDHSWAAEILRERYGVKIVASKEATRRLAIPQNYFNLLYYNDSTPFYIENIDIPVDVNKCIESFGVQVSCILTPGHTSGSMVFLIEDMLFSGDTLLNGVKPVLKRKDGANIEEFLNSVEYLRTTLPADTKVYPGHGDMFLMKDYRRYPIC